MTEGIQVLNLEASEDISFLDLIDGEQRYFDDPEDSALLWRGVCLATQIARKLGISRDLLDLGSGVSLGASHALAQGDLETARAIEVNADAVARGQELATELGVYQERATYEILCADVETATAKRYAQEFQPTIIAGNLPYLPQHLSTPDLTRDAGIDGTRFIKTLLSYSLLPSVRLVTLNMCSMTTPQQALEMLTDYDLAIDTVFAFKAEFGYRTKLLLEQGAVDASRGQYFHVSPDGTPYQVIMNLVLSRNPLRQERVDPKQIMGMLRQFSETGEIQGRSQQRSL